MEMIISEWKSIFKNKMLLLTCIAISFIPLLYSSFFLKSVWDPYGKTGSLPVAVVNQDIPVDFEGRSVDVGDSLITNLKKNKNMDWSFVSSEKAKAGLESGDYYIVVTIPKNFSENATTVLDSSPEKMEIVYETNGSLNFIGRLMGQSATKELKSEVSKQVTSAYADAILAQFDSIGDGLASAAYGATELDSGASKISSGSHSLSEGADKMAESSSDFKTGVESFEDGISKYTDGVSELRNGAEAVDSGSVELSNGLSILESQVSSLPESAEELSEGASNLASGVSKAQSATSALSSGLSEIDSSVQGLSDKLSSAPDLSQAEKLLEGLMQNPDMFSSLSLEQQKSVLSGAYVAVTGLSDIAQSIPTLSDAISQSSQGMATLNSNMTALSSGAQKLSDGASLLEKSAPQLVSGVSSLKSGSEKLSDGSHKVSNGASELDSKGSDLESGAQKISDGAGQIHSGSSDLSRGVGELDSALLSLKSGTGELSDKLQDGAGEISTFQTGEGTVEQISSPADIVEKEYSHVPNYGHALAPYVMSLALFIGCLVFNSIFPIRKLSDKIQSSSSWYLGKFSVGLAVASTMAAVEGSVMIALGLEVNSKPKFFAVLFLTAICYMSIIMTLSMALDNPGRFLSMLLLIVQLGGSGGTFPIELTNGFFQAIHPYLPMSYSIYGLRESISGGIGTPSFIKSISVLSGIFAVFAFTLFLVMNKLFKKIEINKECLEI